MTATESNERTGLQTLARHSGPRGPAAYRGRHHRHRRRLVHRAAVGPADPAEQPGRVLPPVPFRGLLDRLEEGPPDRPAPPGRDTRHRGHRVACHLRRHPRHAGHDRAGDGPSDQRPGRGASTASSTGCTWFEVRASRTTATRRSSSARPSPVRTTWSRAITSR